jgi:hypothetical protein
MDSSGGRSLEGDELFMDWLEDRDAPEPPEFDEYGDEIGGSEYDSENVDPTDFELLETCSVPFGYLNEGGRAESLDYLGLDESDVEGLGGEGVQDRVDQRRNEVVDGLYKEFEAEVLDGAWTEESDRLREEDERAELEKAERDAEKPGLGERASEVVRETGEIGIDLVGVGIFKSAFCQDGSGPKAYWDVMGEGGDWDE